MRRGGRILIILGLLLGAITAGGTFLWISTIPSGGPPISTKKIVVAAQKINERTPITADQVLQQEWLQGTGPEGAGTYYEEPKDVIGKMATQAIFPGVPILKQTIIDQSGAAGAARGGPVSFIVPEGKVAMSFAAGDNVANALQAGDTIDLLLTLNPGLLQATSATTTRPATTATTTTGTEGLPITQIMLQELLIMNVGPWAAATEKSTGGGVLTVAIDRQDALALKSAREQGQIDVVLRRAGDHSKVTTEPVSLQYLNKRFNFNLQPGGGGLR